MELLEIRKRALQQVPIIEAFGRGAEIQCKARDREGAKWTSALTGVFLFDMYDYRVKPAIDQQPSKEYKKKVELAFKTKEVVIEYCPLIYKEDTVNPTFYYITKEDRKRKHRRLNWNLYYYRIAASEEGAEDDR